MTGVDLKKALPGFGKDEAKTGDQKNEKKDDEFRKKAKDLTKGLFSRIKKKAEKKNDG